MALDPHPLDPVALGGGDERLPEIGVLDRFLRRGLPAVLAPAVDPSGEPVHHVAAVGGERDAAWALECVQRLDHGGRSEEHTSELQSLMRISYAVFCLKKKKVHNT